MQAAYIGILLLLFVVIYTQHQNRMMMTRQLMKMKHKGEKTEMKELATRFIGKECIIYTFNAQIEGTIREVGDGAILLERKGSTEAINLDFIMRIREYPRNKNGKKKSIVVD